MTVKTKISDWKPTYHTVQESLKFESVKFLLNEQQKIISILQRDITKAESRITCNVQDKIQNYLLCEETGKLLILKRK